MQKLKSDYKNQSFFCEDVCGVVFCLPFVFLNFNCMLHVACCMLHHVASCLLSSSRSQIADRRSQVGLRRDISGYSGKAIGYRISDIQILPY